jgi:hypothetical protein
MSRLMLALALALAALPLRAADRADGGKVITAPVLPTAGAGVEKLPGAGLVSPLGLSQTGPSAGNTAVANAVLPGGGIAVPGAKAELGTKADLSGKNAVPKLAASAVAAAAQKETAAAQVNHAHPAASGGGTEHPLIEKAKEEARKLGTALELPPSDSDTVSRLGDMKTSGYTMLPAGTLVSQDQARNIAAAIDKEWKPGERPERRTIELRDEYKGWLRDMGGDGAGRGGVLEVMETLTKALRTALPEEDIEIRDVQLRLNYNKHEPDALHVDGGYITATIVLKGPGTLLYPMDANGIRELLAPLNAAAVITNSDRRRAVNIPGTVHSSPSERFYRPGLDDERRILIVRYKRRGQERPDQGAQEALREEDRRRVDRVKRFREVRGGKPPPPKKAWYDPRGWVE